MCVCVHLMCLYTAHLMGCVCVQFEYALNLFSLSKMWCIHKVFAANCVPLFMCMSDCISMVRFIAILLYRQFVYTIYVAVVAAVRFCYLLNCCFRCWCYCIESCIQTHWHRHRHRHHKQILPRIRLALTLHVPVSVHHSIFICSLFCCCFNDRTTRTNGINSNWNRIEWRKKTQKTIFFCFAKSETMNKIRWIYF